MLALKSDILETVEKNIISTIVDNHLKVKGFVLSKIQAKLDSLYFHELSEFLNAEALSFSISNHEKEINIYINDQIMYAEILLKGTLQVIASNCSSFYEDNDFCKIEEIESFIQDLRFMG